jgi:hypothetical protein
MNPAPGLLPRTAYRFVWRPQKWMEPVQIDRYIASDCSFHAIEPLANCLLIPTAGPILEAFEEADFLAAFAMFTFGALPQLGTQSLEPLILGDTDKVIDLVSLTPTQHFPATEPAIGTQDNFNFRPAFSERTD